MNVESKSAFSAISARVIALRIENPYSILRQIANLPQRVATENILRGIDDAALVEVLVGLGAGIVLRSRSSSACIKTQICVQLKL